jgi:hypothetical protein
VRVLEVRAATEADLESAAECIGEAFASGDDAQYDTIRQEVLHAAHDDPFLSLDDLRVGVIDGVVVSTVAVMPRPIHVDGSILSMGGLAGVCTRESHRHHGYNTAVLRDTIQYIEDSGHDISLLYTGIHGYYERLGWRSFEHGVAHDIIVSGDVAAPAFRGSVRPMHATDDLAAVREIYDVTNRDKAGPVARNAAYWTYHSDRLASYHVAVADRRVVAYLHDTDGKRIEEIGYLPGAEDAAVALVADVLQRATAGIERVYLRDGEALLAGIAELGCDVEQLGADSDGRRGPTMYCIMRPAPLLDKLLPRMSERLAASPAGDWSGVVRVQSGVGNVDLKCADASVTRVPDADAPSITLHATHTQTIELVFGQIDAASLVTNAADLTEDAAAVLQALCPRLAYRYYGPDMF